MEADIMFERQEKETWANKTVSKESWKAHNNNREFPCFNENYNSAKKLGTYTDRNLLRNIAAHEYGITDGRHILTRPKLKEYQIQVI